MKKTILLRIMTIVLCMALFALTACTKDETKSSSGDGASPKKTQQSSTDTSDNEDGGDIYLPQDEDIVPAPEQEAETEDTRPAPAENGGEQEPGSITEE